MALRDLLAAVLAAAGFGRAAVAARNRAAYEAASTGRRLGSWYAPGIGPNHVTGSLPTLRNRSRALYRNNPWIANGIDRLVSNEIGTGIVPRSTVDDRDLRARIDALWDRWTEVADPAGDLDFYGLQALAARNRNLSGEVFLRRRVRRVDSGLPVAIQVEVLEADYVPADKNETLPNGNVIIAGIEFDRQGRRVAYHMHRDHPGDQGSRWGDLVRVPAANVIHHFLPVRAGQVRGEPVTVEGIVTAKTYDSYEDAELVRKQTRAPYTGFLTRESYDQNDYLYDPFTGAPLNRDADGVPTLDVQPGTILTGLPGEKLTLFDGDKTGEGFAEFARQQLLRMSAALGLPYELMTNDWSGVNDRLVRAILNEFHRAVEALQDHLMVHQVCRRVWGWVIDRAVLTDVLPLRDYAERREEYLRHEWRPHGWAYVHPEQDVNAKLKAIEGGLTSRDAEIAKTGWDPEEIDRQNVEAEVRLRELRRAAGLEPEETTP